MQGKAGQARLRKQGSVGGDAPASQACTARADLDRIGDAPAGETGTALAAAEDTGFVG